MHTVVSTYVCKCMINSLSFIFSFLLYTTASIPKIHNLLPFWLAKKVIALAKYTWSLYCQWRHSTITPTNAKKDSTTKEESSHEEPPAKTSKRTVRGVNGGLDKSKGDGELDEGSSKDEREGTSSDDGTNKVKRRRGESKIGCCYRHV